MLVDRRHMVITSKSGSGMPDPWLRSQRELTFLTTFSSQFLRRGSMVDARQRQARAQEQEVVESEHNERRLEEEAARAKLMVEGKQRMQAAEEEEDEVVEDELNDGALDEVGAKLVVHLQEAAERAQLAVGPGGRDQERDAGAETEPTGSLDAADATKTWNLRARTSVRRVVRYGFEPEAVKCCRPAKPVRQRSWDAARNQRSRFSIPLTTEEIADDIYGVTGSPPRRRPKRRVLVLQRQLDALFPGSLLTEVTADSYKVSD